MGVFNNFCVVIRLQEIMMDHALRTISYIADIGDLVVLMARRRFVPHDVEDPSKISRTPKMICHVFESDEVRILRNHYPIFYDII